MKVHYRKPIEERLMDVIHEAEEQDRKIDCIELDARETREMLHYLREAGFINSMCVRAHGNMFKGVRIDLDESVMRTSIRC